MWTTDVPLDRVHEARTELNVEDSSIDQDKLKKYDPLLLASLLRLYLQELPECLLTFDLYDPVKVLYADSKFTCNSAFSGYIEKKKTSKPFFVSCI